MLLLSVLTAQSTEDLTGVAGFVVDVVDALGPVGVGVLVFIENLFPPIPSEVVLPLAGFLAGRGTMDLWAVILWSTLGSVLGAVALYAIAAAFGEARLRRLVERLPIVDQDGLDRASAWFADHGESSVFFGRMVPLVRSLISLPAGLQRMPLPRFVVLTTLGSGAWNALWAWLGWLVGERWKDVAGYADLLNYAVIAAMVLFVGRAAWRKARAD